MEGITGVSDVDILILSNLDNKSLSKAALVSSYVNSLMDEQFWASRFHNKYGVTLWNYGVSHREIYKEFSNLKDEDLVRKVVDYNFIELVELLLKDKENLLIYAARKGHLEVVKLLLDKGANIHADDCLVLRFAAEDGHLEVVKLLLDKGAVIHIDNMYALQWAAGNGHLDVVKLLLDNGADIHADDGLALQWAAEKGHLKVVELLFVRGANIHADDDLALRWAAMNGHLEVVELLLDKGANIHAINNYALRGAADNGHLEVVKLLLDKGAIANDRTIKLINILDSSLLKEPSNQSGITKTGYRWNRAVKKGIYCFIHNK